MHVYFLPVIFVLLCVFNAFIIISNNIAPPPLFFFYSIYFELLYGVYFPGVGLIKTAIVLLYVPLRLVWASCNLWESDKERIRERQHIRKKN